MGEPLEKTATYEDLLAVPEHLVAEIIDGRLVTHPRPRMKHGVAMSALGHKIGGPFHYDSNGPGGWWIVIEPELHLANRQIVVPDLAGWRRERLPVIPDAAFTELAPDWVCEVISPSTARYDRLEKRRIYAENGVQHLWLVDPDARTLEAFELKNGQWLLVATRGNDEEVAVAPFEAAPFSLAALWSE